MQAREKLTINRIVDMNAATTMKKNGLTKGVIFNAYPDSIGQNLADMVSMLKRPEFKDTFSLLYLLPTFFNSDMDRGFSIIDYNLNQALVADKDLAEIEKLGIMLKVDLVLNHLSVASPQFQDMLKYGDDSYFKDFFVDWNKFWYGHGELGDEGYVIPNKEHLQKLFMRKPGLPILKVRFPDGTDRPYWNTFYQEVTYQQLTAEDLHQIQTIPQRHVPEIVAIVNQAIIAKVDLATIDFGEFSSCKQEVIAVIEQKRRYLGQMDLNALSETVWDFYDETLKKLRDYGAILVRLDAFAYLHKRPGMTNFFNKPGTWNYLERLKQIAEKYELVLLPEIHSEYGNGLHQEVADKGFPVYDFFFPGLLIDALDRSTNKHLLRWIGELVERDIKTINMLGSHDGIPVLDLKGNDSLGAAGDGLLSDVKIDAVIEIIMNRGGLVKNLYGPDGKKISYYQVNATFFSALGEDQRKMRLARAIQMFMPGIPQVWYLDLFMGKNDYAAADQGGSGGHKEINRTTLQPTDIEHGLKQTVVRDQLKLLRLRNNSPAFNGNLNIHKSAEHCLHLSWENNSCVATLNSNLSDYSFTITHRDDTGVESSTCYD